MDSVDAFADAEVIKIRSPAPGWIPLRYAPFLFQAVLRRRQSLTQLRQPNPALLSRRLIDAIVQQSVDPGNGRCQVDRDEYRFVLFDEIDYSDADVGSLPISRSIAPFALPEGWADDPASQRLAGTISSTWRMMEARLRRAIDAGYCRALARCGTAHAPSFSELLPEIFARYKIIDWQNGVAESVSGTNDHLYDLHVAPNKSADELASIEIDDLARVTPEPVAANQPLDAQSEYQNGYQEVSAARRAELAALTCRFKERAIDVARFYYFEPEAEPAGDVITKRDKNRICDVIGNGVDPRTISRGLRLAQNLRAKNPSSHELRAIGFHPLSTDQNRKGGA